MKKFIAIALILISFASAVNAQKSLVLYANMEKAGSISPRGGELTWDQTVIMRTRIRITATSITIDNAAHRIFTLTGTRAESEGEDGSTTVLMPAKDKNDVPCDIILVVQKDGTTTFTVVCKKFALQYPVPTKG